MDQPQPPAEQQLPDMMEIDEPQVLPHDVPPVPQVVPKADDAFRKSANEVARLALLVQQEQETDHYLCGQTSITLIADFIAAWRIHDRAFPGHGSPTSFFHGKAKLRVPPVVLAATVHSASCQSAIEKDGQVKTSSGLITGHTSPNTSCVLEFLGIPYAKPPVGDLRFAPPQKLFTGDISYNASSFGYDCPLTPSKPSTYRGLTPQAQRIINAFASAAGTPQSEDCLTLNIWTPLSSTLPQPLKPVLIFFYGGRFTIGNTNTPFYHGARLASAQDMIVVTVNYRLNIFGFPGSRHLPFQNLGLRDQRLAVEWVRDNILSFGGDPKKMVLGGQSSGAVSVDYWAYAYKEDPIVQGLIAHSGTAFSFPANSEAVQDANFDTVVGLVNCSSFTNPIPCMRGVSWQTLLAAASSIKPGKSTSPLRGIPPFWPTPDKETVFSAGEYVSLTRTGDFAHVPILLGSTDNEAGYYRVPAYAQNITPTVEEIASFHLESFTCPVLYQAKGREEKGVPAFVYRYFPDWENTRLYNGSGAYHGVDVHMVFGNSEVVSGIGMGEEQMGLMGWVQRVWGGFVADPVGGMEGVGWERFGGGGGGKLAEIGRGEKAEVEFVDVGGYERDCEGVVLGALGEVSG
ncbi:putative lipase [Cercophora samala]|uniref:Carboxylic ester hydrolase n=1 Tax=Cercophora samala TaxID=330535 RepID=A0AA40DAT7_9PEZI|nr:putative lipase [Cercophora samala]